MAQNPVEILGRVAQTPLGRRIPLFAAGVPAGFPSPADDYVDRHLDLHEHLIEHPAATFYVRASGDSMVGAGIHDGDLLIVDRAVEPRDGHVVIAVVHGELTVKRLRRRRGRLYLVSDGNAHPPLAIWGVWNPLAEGADCIFVFFNNCRHGQAAKNALRFAEIACGGPANSPPPS